MMKNVIYINWLLCSCYIIVGKLEEGKGEFGSAFYKSA